MQKLITYLFITILSLTKVIFAQDQGDTGLSVYGNYSIPIAGLSDWFKPTINFGISFGQQTSQDWFFEGIIEYSKFDEENLKGYAANHVELSLEHTGILVNGRYSLSIFSGFKTYLNIGGGLYYWKGSRSRIQADSTLMPALPLIDEKILEEWNWGFRTGVGIEYLMTESLSLDILASYRFIVGDLWPTLQPYILIENVSGFQTVNVALIFRYYFKG